MEAAKSLFVLGLGANLGDRLQNLREAAAAFQELIVATSWVYQTPAAGGPAQPHYLNAAICIATALRPAELLERALASERRLGRQRPDPVRWGPRTIDIDILWWSGGVFDDGRLVIPHPRLQQRAFALQPLLDVLPNACDPVSGEPYRCDELQRFAKL